MKFHFAVFVLLIFISNHEILRTQTEGAKPFMRFKNISGNHGLPGEWARCMFQDSRGLMWFGTDIGFKYFDGYGYREYPLIQGDMIVSAITEDHLGNIWAFANATAIYHLDRKRDVVTRHDLGAIVRSLFDKRTYNAWDEDGGRPLSGSSECLFEDSKQRLWVSTVWGFMQFDWDTERFILVKKKRKHYIGWLFEDEDQQLWEVLNNGVRRFNAPDSHLIPFTNRRGELQRVRNITHVVRDHAGDYWLVTRTNGIFQFNQKTRLLTQYNHNPGDPSSLSYNKVTHLMEDHKHRIWVAADIGGLDLFDRSTKRFYHYPHRFRNVEELATIPVHLFEDRTNGFWISHYYASISYVGSSSKAFRAYSSFIGDSKSLSYPYVTSFFERSNGDIWLGTNGGGLNLWHRQINEFSHFMHQADDPNSLSNNKVHQVIEDKDGYTWIRMMEKIDRFDIESGNFKTYPISGRLYLTQKGEVWLGGEGELYKYDRNTDSFQLRLSNFRGLFEDREGHFWVSPSRREICKYDLDSNELSNCFVSNARSISEDSEGNFWMLCSEQQDTLKKYNPLTGVFSDTVVIRNSRGQLMNRMIVDDNNHVWLGTKEGLYRYNPESKQLKQFDYSDGLSSNFLRFGQPIKTRKGELLFGSSKGFTIFHPDSIKENTVIPPTIITNFQIGVQDVPVAGTPRDTLAWKSPLKEHIHFADSVRVKHSQNNFTFEFAALDYTNPQKNRYKYKLDGYDKNWTFTDASLRLARYTNLSPGNYTFQVHGANNDGYWNEHGDSLVIMILPPWYWSWWSKTLYILAVLGLLYTFYRFQLNRQLAAAESNRLKELDAVKSRLYTNITHEFRTPLTVISGMADQVLNNPREWFREGLGMIKRNSQQLLRLVNQLLDLSKLESGRLPVNFIQDDIINYLKYLTESFHSFAQTKNIRLHLLTEVEKLEMDFDPQKIQIVVSNLVGNAIKFTEAGGDVYITVDDRWPTTDNRLVRITVKDSGIGISKAKLPYIFDRFYQADDSATRKGEGTGIGLALTKEFVGLMGGEIEVRSQLNKGTEFAILLPVKQEAKKGIALSIFQNEQGFADSHPNLITPVVPSSPDQEQPLALLIEDNMDVLQYLVSCLQGQYRLQTAGNGEEGIKKAIELVPDIIVSDVMMPGKDGYEVIEVLRNDQCTSHIPIILLTAKADVESRLEGLERGADAYLAKPFNKKELAVRLRKLIELRKALQSRYGSSSTAGTDPHEGLSKEETFLLKIRELVVANLSNESYGILQLCLDLAISRTQLHRKLKALTGKSTSHLIRSVRLQKAKELLQTADLNVSEVAYKVGFSNRSHFSQEFTKEFGEPPSFFKE